MASQRFPWPEMRRIFETTDRSLRSIALEYECSAQAVWYRAIRDEWQRGAQVPCDDSQELRDALRKRCNIHGCPVCSKWACTYCGWNWREEAIRKGRGLTRDRDGLWHLTPSVRDEQS